MWRVRDRVRARRVPLSARTHPTFHHNCCSPRQRGSLPASPGGANSRRVNYAMGLAIILFSLCQPRAYGDVAFVLRSLDEEPLRNQEIIRVAKFPDGPSFNSRNGYHVDAGYRYSVYEVNGVPLWTYDGQWCGYINSGSFVNLNRGDLEELAADANISLPDAPDLSFWYVNLGELLVVLTAALCLARWVYRRIRPPRSTPSDAVNHRERDELLKEAKVYAHDGRLVIVACLAKFAKIDGVVSRNEIAIVEEI
jgi:hypothetical protein